MNNGPKETPDESVEVPNPEDPDDRDKIKKPRSMPKLPSQKFQVHIAFSTTKHATQETLSLQWFERGDRLPTMVARTGEARAGEWYDAQRILTTSTMNIRRKDGRDRRSGDKDRDLITIADYVMSKQFGTATYWVNTYLKDKAKVCPRAHESFYIEDEPAAAPPRTLEFHIVVESPAACGCPKPTKLELYATQVLATGPMKPGDREQADADQRASGLYGPDGLLKPNGVIQGKEDAAKPKLP